MPRPMRRIREHLGLGIGRADMPLHLDRVKAAKGLLDLMGVAYVTGPARWASGLAEAGFGVVVPPTATDHGLWRNAEALLQVERNCAAPAGLTLPHGDRDRRPRRRGYVSARGSVGCCVEADGRRME